MNEPLATDAWAEAHHEWINDARHGRLSANAWGSQRHPENRHGTRSHAQYAAPPADLPGPKLPGRVRRMNPRRAKAAWARAEGGTAADRSALALRRYVIHCKMYDTDMRMLRNAV